MKRDKTGKFAQTWVGETKQAVKLSLTNTAWQLLAEQAKTLGVSRSELIERYARQGYYNCGEHAVDADPGNTNPLSQAGILDDSATPLSPAAQIALLQQQNSQLHHQIAQLQQQVDAARSQAQQLRHRLQHQTNAQTNERQWLEAVLNLLPTPLILVDPQQYCVTFSNRAANAIAGVDLAKDVGATYNEDYHCIDMEGRIIPPDQTPAARAAQGEKFVGTEISWHTPVGTFPLLVYADTVPAMHDRPATSVVIFQDISKRKQMEEQLQESQRFIQQVADATPGLLYIYDVVAQRNVYVNRQIVEILGYTTDEIQVMDHLLFPTLMHPEDLATLPEHIKRLDQAQDGKLIEREYRMRHANGEWRWLWSRDLVFSRTETNAPHQLIGIAHDITDRKQAELNLRVMEERLSLVLQATNDAIYDRHLKTGTVWWNQAYDQLVGKRPPEKSSSQWWVERLHPDDRDQIVNSFDAALARDDERWSAEYRYQRADGNYANVIDRTYILRDAAGQAERYLGAISDVTHLKQVEQDLKQTQERLQLALASACMVAWDIDLQANKVVCSANAMEVWGIQPSSLQIFLTAVHPEDRQHLLEALERAKTGEEDYHLECRMVRHDGSTGWFNSQGRVYFSEHGQASRMVGVSADVSERRRAEMAAAKSADRTARLQTITAALSEALTPRDVATVVVEQALAALGACRGLVMLLTARGEELELLGSVGYSPEALSNWQRIPITARVPLTDVIQTQTPLFLQSFDEAIAAYPQFATMQNTPSRAIAAIPLIAENSVLGSLGIGFSETHAMNEEDRAFVLALARHCAQAIRRAQLYQVGQEAREQAEAANRTKDEFLAVLSHELRTPLNPILGWTGLLRQGKLDANRTAIALETIERNAKLQVQLIEDLLDISRILQGKLVLTPSPVNLVSIIDAAIGTVRLAADAKHIQIRTHIATHVAAVLGDATRLQQVVWNLLANAVKFTPEQGQIDIQLTTVGAYTQICVKDTGQGIRAEFLPFVFDTFRQADSSITRAFGGLGLGLAIVHHIVELHGGTTQVESAGEGQGATFTIQLPILSTTEIPQPKTTSPHHRLTLQGVKVLAVDDEVDNLELATFILEKAGASVFGIASASKILPLLLETKPDILLLDIGMPEIDGYTLLQQIRALPREEGGQIPAIALTAYAGEVDYQRAMAAGYNRHLAKPIEPDRLIRAIADLVQKAI